MKPVSRTSEAVSTWVVSVICPGNASCGGRVGAAACGIVPAELEGPYTCRRDRRDVLLTVDLVRQRRPAGRAHLKLPQQIAGLRVVGLEVPVRR